MLALSLSLGGIQEFFSFAIDSVSGYCKMEVSRQPNNGENMSKQTKPLSASCLKSLAKSPEHCWANHLDPDKVRTESESMQLGSLIHCMLLEPKMVDSRYAMIPEGMIRRGAKWNAWVLETGTKRAFVKSATWEKATQAVARIKKDEVAGMLLNGRKRSIDKERLFEWSEWVNKRGDDLVWPVGRSVRMNGYIDLVNHTTKRIVDIKTTSNADDLSKLAKDGRWDLQAVQYISAMQHLYDDSYKMFFLVVEVNSPFRIRAVELSLPALKQGRLDRIRLICEFMERLESDNWSGNTGLSSVDMPAWFSRTLEDLNEQC